MIVVSCLLLCEIKFALCELGRPLIRAEDMKKGVFSTIGQLPKEEPRKGSIAASAAV